MANAATTSKLAYELVDMVYAIGYNKCKKFPQGRLCSLGFPFCNKNRKKKLYTPGNSCFGLDWDYMESIIMKGNILKTALIRTIPVMTGYLVLGFGFGILSEKNGYGILWALAMSAFIYAGSMQYVTISLLTSGASLVTAALTTLMVNARHLFYGISMIEKYRGTGKKKPYLIFALTDETYSLVCGETGFAGEEQKKYYFCVSLCNQLYWIAGSVAGAWFGSVVTFNTAGIDFAMTALFVTVFVEQWLSTKNHILALIGLGASIVCLVIFGSDKFLIPAMILISVLLLVFQKQLEEKSGGQNYE